MKRPSSYSLLIVSILIVISIASTNSFAQGDWRQIPIPPLRSFQPKQPKRIQLPNGMVIFLQEDRELPEPFVAESRELRHRRAGEAGDDPPGLRLARVAARAGSIESRKVRSGSRPGIRSAMLVLPLPAWP